VSAGPGPVLRQALDRQGSSFIGTMPMNEDLRSAARGSGGHLADPLDQSPLSATAPPEGRIAGDTSVAGRDPVDALLTDPDQQPTV
jgi:hypothetical protein